MTINKVFLTGNITRDPELRTTANGFNVLNAGITVNERYKSQQTGEWEDRPNFFDLTVLGKRAESLSRILRKGMKVSVEGRLRYESWEKDGQKRSKVSVTVDEVELPQREQGGSYGHQKPSQGYSQQGGYADEDLPF